MRAFVRHLRPTVSKPKDMSTKSQLPVILYDIPLAKEGVCWSPNVWRIRMTLNYKRIPYKTEWVEYPDIGKVGREIGAKPTTPNPDGTDSMLWTCPMLIDPNHLDSEGKQTVLSDSIVIAKHLDEKYPDRQVIPEGTAAFHNVWQSFVAQNVIGKMAGLLVPECPAALGPRGREYFITTRQKWWGPQSLTCPDREKAWKAVEEGLSKVAAALDANGEGEGRNLRVIPGRECYADFAMLAAIQWVVAIATKEEIDRLKSWNDGRWGKLLELHAELFRVD